MAAILSRLQWVNGTLFSRRPRCMSVSVENNQPGRMKQEWLPKPKPALSVPTTEIMGQTKTEAQD